MFVVSGPGHCCKWGVIWLWLRHSWLDLTWLEHEQYLSNLSCPWLHATRLSRKICWILSAVNKNMLVSWIWLLLHQSITVQWKTWLKPGIFTQQAPANRNARSKQWQPWLAVCQRKRLRFLRFSFTQRKRLRLNGNPGLTTAYMAWRRLTCLPVSKQTTLKSLHYGSVKVYCRLVLLF